MQGKSCLITGGAGGIGRATAIALRDRDAQVSVVDLPGKPSPKGVAKIDADLSCRAGIQEMLREVKETHHRLDVLVNNVGGIFPDRKETLDGLEMTFALNYLSYFMTILGLIDLLKRSTPSLVVNVSSSHYRAGRIDFGDLQGQQKYDMNKAYCQSKLANVLFTTLLARRLEGSGVTTFSVHPGAISSSFGDILPGFWGFMWRISSPLRKTPEYAGELMAKLISLPEAPEMNGKYFTGGMNQKILKRGTDADVSNQLWTTSLELTGLTDPS